MACCWRGAGAERWPWGHGERGLVRRGAWDCPWWMGGAVSMRWAGRLWAGPDGLAGLRAAVCARQTVVGETSISTQRLPECGEGGERKKFRQKTHGDHCAKRNQKKNCPTSASGKAPKKLETILSLYPTSRRQPALSILSTTTTWCPPTPSPPPPLWRSKTTHRNPCTWPALPLSDALWI